MTSTYEEMECREVQGEREVWPRLELRQSETRAHIPDHYSTPSHVVSKPRCWVYLGTWR